MKKEKLKPISHLYKIGFIYDGIKDKMSRPIKHLFKSGVLYAGIDHFLAMFPATVLVPYVINDKFKSDIIDVSLVLMASGFGTLLFIILTKGKVPDYLGSSFAYIGMTWYLISIISTDKGITPYDAYYYVLLAYIFAAFLLMLFSFAYKFGKTIKLMKFLFPTAIIGPAISLIGLELANTAATHAGISLRSGSYEKLLSMSVAITTLVIIVIASIARRRHFRNASIVFGMIIGYLISWFFDLAHPIDMFSAQIWSIPKINFPHSLPPDIWQLFIAVIPSTVVVFAEHIGRTTVINRMQIHYGDGKDTLDYFKSVQSSLRAHAASVALSGLIGSVPTTLYAENIAVMSINGATLKQKEDFHDPNPLVMKLYNPMYFMPYVIAAIIAISVSFLNIIQLMLDTIPKPVIGGMELFLFGIIAAPGIQLIVETGVDFRKLTNQILTASVLIAGISGFSFDFGIVQLKGMSLGLAAGVVMNLLFKSLEKFGLLNESLTFLEVLEICLADAPGQRSIENLRFSENSTSDNCSNYITEINKMDTEDILKLLRGQETNTVNPSNNHALLRSVLTYAHAADVKDTKENVSLHIQREANGVTHIIIRMPKDEANALLNDYECVSESDKSDTGDGLSNVKIRLDGQIPFGKIKKLLREAFSPAT